MNACIRLLVALVRSLICAAAILPMRGDELERAFASPPASARPWVYWFWMDGNVSREGITADLEAMQRAGLGGVIGLIEVVAWFLLAPSNIYTLMSLVVGATFTSWKIAKSLGERIDMWYAERM